MATTPAPTPSPARAGHEGRFLPGQVLAGRYRIVALLGAGGMGEVYRADDLRLGAPVALKFLPERLHGDPAALAQLAAEVRLARQVAHPGVCRVHDVGEVEGATFLSMEYVDGEDLDGLLRRVGRLPGTKVVEIARDLAAGLAAAHAAGVLHGDLKPANVMLDGRGRARIADFGLARLAGEELAHEGVRGTPAYLAPELWREEPASAQSDLYALGLVLYEAATGRRALDARDPLELLRLHRDVEPVPPGELVPELDSALERAVLACLAKDPARRPASALALLAALPGGDPLAAALAAGETPSPELVASAGTQGALRPVFAAALAALALLAVLGVAALNDRALLSGYMDPLPPAVLEHRAGELLRALGVETPAAADAAGFGTAGARLRELRAREGGPARFEALRAAAPPWLIYWRRTSPLPMAPLQGSRIRWSDPPLDVSGMTRVLTDGRGRLLVLDAVPPAGTVEADPLEEVDWAPFFAAAELDIERFEPAAPRLAPHVGADGRRAWKGPAPEGGERALHVEAWSLAGRPTGFRLAREWELPKPGKLPEPRRSERFGDVVLVLLLLGVGGWLARRNLRSGRADRRGALLLAGGLALAHLAAWLLGASHVAHSRLEYALLMRELGEALRLGLLAWIGYLALDPFLRRHWPELLVSWSRLRSGRWRDPLVGRELMLGVALGGLFALAHQALVLGLGALRPQGFAPTDFDMAVLDGSLATLSRVLYVLADSTVGAVMMLFLLAATRAVARRRWLAYGLMLLLLLMVWGPGLSELSLGLVPYVVVATAFVALIAGTGFVALVTAMTWYMLLLNFPAHLDLGAWWMDVTWALLGVTALVALAGYGLATRPGAAAARI